MNVWSWKYRGGVVVGCAVALALGVSAWGQLGPATQAAPAPATQAEPGTVELDKALAASASDDFATRTAANAKLKAVLTAEITQLSTQQDPEVRAQAQDALNYVGVLCNWINNTANLPGVREHKVVEWALQPEIAELIVDANGSDSAKQQKALAALAGHGEEQASYVLAGLLSDGNQQRQLQTMDAIWNRKPDAVILDALWNNVATVLKMEYFYEISTFQGQNFAVSVPMRQEPVTVADGAAKLLAHYASERTGQQLQTLCNELFSGNPDRNNFREQQLGMIAELGESTKAKSLIPLAFKLATGVIGWARGSSGNGMSTYQSTRTDMLGLVVKLSGQDPKDYQLRVDNQPLEGHWVSVDKASEEKAVAKLKEWWKDHEKDYAATQEAP